METKIVSIVPKFLDPLLWAKLQENPDKTYFKTLFKFSKWQEIEIRYVSKKIKSKHINGESMSYRNRYILWIERKKMSKKFNFVNLPQNVIASIYMKLSLVELLAMFYAFPYHRIFIALAINISVEEKEVTIYRVRYSLDHLIYNYLRKNTRVCDIDL